jgi:hypothetical protein
MMTRATAEAIRSEPERVFSLERCVATLQTLTSEMVTKIAMLDARVGSIDPDAIAESLHAIARDEAETAARAVKDDRDTCTAAQLDSLRTELLYTRAHFAVLDNAIMRLTESNNTVSKRVHALAQMLDPESDSESAASVADAAASNATRWFAFAALVLAVACGVSAAMSRHF